jgi:hypothetical protein
MSKSTPKPSKWFGWLRRGVAWTTLWAVGILGLIIIINPSEPFKGCVHNNKNGAQYQELHERNTAPVPRIMQFYLRFRLVGTCVANFADHNERTIGALAAVALAVFTLYLWRATHGLRRYAGIQASDMQKLLAAARDNASAATGLRAAAEAQERTMQEQAKAMTAVATAARQSADIARRALTELERPYVIVRVPISDIKVNEIGNYSSFGHARWDVFNYGRTPALLVERITRWKVEVDGNLPYTIDPNIAKGLPFPEGCLASRETPYSENHNYFIELDGYQDIYGARAGHRHQIWCFGYLRYRDILDGVYVNGFALVYDHIGERFVHIGPPNLNYTRVEKQPGT